MLGYRPYKGKDKQEIKFNVMSHQAKITKKEKTMHHTMFLEQLNEYENLKIIILLLMKIL